LFVVEQRGRIRILDSSRSLVGNDFINLGTGGLARVSSSGSERGLLGLAFHPQYANNGRFFVNYTRQADGATVIAEYHVSADPNIAEPTERIILGPIPQPFLNHNGGHLAFGPDGYLYIGMGDGGNGGDPLNNGQNLETLLGKILRIDINSSTQTYSIPPDNPILGEGHGLDEIYAYGLRNPWRFSFDRQDGRLFCGDVGQNSFEEIDLIQRGDNLGWRIMEGTHCFSPSVNCPTAGLTLPIMEYGRDLGISVTGGFVYRGSRFPDLNGLYLFGDFGTGRIWSGTEIEPGIWHQTQLLDTSFNISTFGEDEAGELYFASYGGGQIRQIIIPVSTPTPTQTATSTLSTTSTPTPTHTLTPTDSPIPTVTPTTTSTPRPSGHSNWILY
jgi:glucose/arabinose dehydrogenase